MIFEKNLLKTEHETFLERKQKFSQMKKLRAMLNIEKVH